MSKHTLFNILILVLLLGACSSPASGNGIEVKDAWVRSAVMTGMENQENSASGGTEEMSGSNSAAYMVIRNNSNQADKLVKVESDAAKSVELHLSEMVDDVMTMHPVDGVDIPANGQAELKPGSYHVMLVDITRDLNPGDSVDLKLTFEKAGTMEITAEVRQP